MRNSSLVEESGVCLLYTSNVVVVRHDNGLESIYSHNSRNLVKSGDIVKAGDAVGRTGRTGRATTEHLHLEFRIDGQHFNPNLIFDMKGRTLRKTDVYKRQVHVRKLPCGQIVSAV